MTKKTTAVKAKAVSTGAAAGKAVKKLLAKAEVKPAPIKAAGAKTAPLKAAPPRSNGKPAAVEVTAPAVKAVAPIVTPAPRGRPGRKPKPTEEQLMGADAAVPEAGDDVADPSVQIVER